MENENKYIQTYIIFLKLVYLYLLLQKNSSTWDERDEDYKPVDKSEVHGNIADIVEVFYLAEGKENQYTYDAKGNRISYSGYTGNNPERKTAEYYPNCDLLKQYGEWKFSYDANGNLINRGTKGEWNGASFDYAESSGELWQYEYDLSNRMTRVLHSTAGSANLKEKASYVYDYRGLCVEKKTPAGSEFREYTADGKLLYTEKGEDRTDYIYKSNTVFAEIRREREGEAVYYHHTDHLGTTRAVSDENGVVVWEAETEAFGSVLSENGTKGFTASFTGKLYDEDAGMYYFNARWYDSEIGRFVTQDPARDGANWYGYCSNNPLIYTDPTGAFDIKADYKNDALFCFKSTTQMICVPLGGGYSQDQIEIKRAVSCTQSLINVGISFTNSKLLNEIATGVSLFSDQNVGSIVKTLAETIISEQISGLGKALSVKDLAVSLFSTPSLSSTNYFADEQNIDDEKALLTQMGLEQAFSKDLCNKLKENGILYNVEEEGELIRNISVWQDALDYNQIYNIATEVKNGNELYSSIKILQE